MLFCSSEQTARSLSHSGLWHDCKHGVNIPGCWQRDYKNRCEDSPASLDAGRHSCGRRHRCSHGRVRCTLDRLCACCCWQPPPPRCRTRRRRSGLPPHLRLPIFLLASAATARLDPAMLAIVCVCIGEQLLPLNDNGADESRAALLASCMGLNVDAVFRNA